MYSILINYQLAYTVSLDAAQAWSFSTGTLTLKPNAKTVATKAAQINATVGA